LGLLLLLAAVTPAAAGELRVWPTAVVSGDKVTLADVAELSGFDSAAADRLSDIVVQAAPSAGGEIAVRINDIRGALAEANADLSSIQILGSSRCKVSKPRPPREPAPPPIKAAESREPSPQRPAKAALKIEQSIAVDPESLEAAVRQFIASRTPDPGGKLEIRFSPANRNDLQLRLGSDRIEIHPKEDRTIGLLSYEVDILRGEQVERTIPLVADVSLVKDVVVARRPINRGALIEGRDLRLEERRFADLESVGITDLAAAVGQQSARFVKPGEMLATNYVQAKAMIGRGDRVTIWNRQGSLLIKATGTAQQAGSLGETIAVRRDGSKKKEDVIDAEVTGPATVALIAARQVAQR
jgi:flagella basal body P-ring formation protein FlgA